MEVFSLHTSIQRFVAFGTYNLQKAIEKFISHPEDIASFVNDVQQEVLKFGLDIISETLEDCNQFLVESEARKQKWHVVRTDLKQLLTSMGPIIFHKTLFKHKATGKSKYLLDKYLKIESHERISEDAKACILKEASQTSYRKAGENASILDMVSKQAVMDIVHELHFPKEKYSGEKKVVKYLYVDADEDHIALQKAGELHSTITKMVYVYEGIESEYPGSKRRRLVNPHYFCGLYSGKENKRLWVQVYRYIEQHYDLDKIKRIYINADGGIWIKTALSHLDKSKYVLDGFHLNQTLFRMTACLKGAAGDARSRICSLIAAGKPKELQKLVKKIAEGTDTKADEKRLLDGLDYLLNNFKAAQARLSRAKGLVACSAEGHVSHVLSARMSSRPMAWSLVGADAMARLRAYSLNGGKMIDLVRFQKKPIEIEEDEICFTPQQMIAFENKARRPYGKYFDGIQCGVSSQTIKKMWFQHQVRL